MQLVVPGYDPEHCFSIMDLYDALVSRYRYISIHRFTYDDVSVERFYSMWIPMFHVFPVMWDVL